MKNWVLLFFLLALSPNVRGQVVDKFFASVPQTVLPLLDNTSKLDLLDLYNGNLPAKAENVMGGQSEIVRKTDDFLMLNLTDASTWQLKVLHYEQDTVLVCIHSVNAGSVLSKITVYDSDWRKKNCEMPHPVAEDFYLAENKLTSVQCQMVQALLPGLPMEIEWNDSVGTLTYRLNTQSLSEEMRKRAETCLRPLYYRWGKGGFVETAWKKETE